MTNKPIYIKIYDKLKSAIKGGTYRREVFFPHEQEWKLYTRSAALLSARL